MVPRAVPCAHEGPSLSSRSAPKLCACLEKAAPETAPPASRVPRCAASSGSSADSADTGEWGLRSCGAIRVRSFAAPTEGGRARAPGYRLLSSNPPGSAVRQTTSAGMRASPETRAVPSKTRPDSRGHEHVLGSPWRPVSRPRNGPPSSRRPDSRGPSGCRFVHGATSRGGPRRQRSSRSSNVASGRSDVQGTNDVSMRIQAHLRLFQGVRACAVGGFFPCGFIVVRSSFTTTTTTTTTTTRRAFDHFPWFGHCR